MKHLLPLVFALLSLPALSQGRPLEGESTFTLRGIVVNFDKLPLANVKVWYSMAGPVTTTDSLGRFALHFKTDIKLSAQKNLLIYAETVMIRFPVELPLEAMMHPQVIRIDSKRHR